MLEGEATLQHPRRACRPHPDGEYESPSSAPGIERVGSLLGDAGSCL